MRYLFLFIFIQSPSFLFSQKPVFISPTGHNGIIQSCEFSPNGKYLATGADDGTVKLWEPYSTKLVHTFFHPVSILNDLGFSPDGSVLATAYDDGMVDLWSVNSGQLIKRIQAHGLYCKLVTFSNDGRYLLTASTNMDSSKIWELSTGKLVRMFSDETSTWQGSFSATGEKLVFNSHRVDKIQLYDAVTGILEKEYPGNTRVYFSKQKKHFAYSNGDSLFVRNTGNGQLEFSLCCKIIDKIDISNDKELVFSSGGGISKYDLVTKKLLFEINISDTSIESLHSDPAGNYIYISDNKDARMILDGKTGTTLARIPKGISYYNYKGEPQYHYTQDVSFSPDGKLLALQENDSTIIWDLSRQQYAGTIKSHTRPIIGSYWAAGDQFLFVNLARDHYESADLIQAFDIRNNRLSHILKGNSFSIRREKLDRKGKILLYTNKEGKAEVIELASRKIIFTSPDSAFAVSITGDGSKIITSKQKEVYGVTDLLKKKDLFTLKCKKTAWHPDGIRLAALMDNKRILIYDSRSGKAVDSVFYDDDKSIVDMKFSDNGKKLLLRWQHQYKQVDNISILEYPSKKTLLSIDDPYAWIEEAHLNSDGTQLLTYSSKGMTAELWDVGKGKLDTALGPHPDFIGTIGFFNEAKYVYTQSYDGLTYIWKNHTYEKIDSLRGVYSFGVNDDSDTALITYVDGSVDFYSIRDRRSLVRFLVVDSTDWIVTNSTGLFDASGGSGLLSHFSANDSNDLSEPWKIIDFMQLKQRYYQPGLLRASLGITSEKLREVPVLSDLPLAPGIATDYNNYKLSLQLTDKGGGIGKITVHLNNAEILETQPSTEKPTVKNEKSSTQIDLETYRELFYTDETNILKITAYNKDNWLSSQPIVLRIPPGDSKGLGLKPGNREKNLTKPKFHAIICGTSDYSGTNIDLKYASKDAEDFSQALKLAAIELFGAENVNITVLHSNAPDSLLPTKQNFLKAFQSLQSTERNDIILVYLSGHGVNYGGQDGDFYYLLSQASGADPAYLQDPYIRQTTTLSSNELALLFNEKKAGKKVLILDACASGKAAENLTIAMRDIPASQVRAIDRMADRTGFYVLSGSAADAVSYETSVYGQGLLTYALLKSIRGAALRKDGNEEYVDLHKMLQYAVDEVPYLAKGIGGIQQPLFRSPGDQKSFDIGRVNAQIKKLIVLSEPKPVFIASNFINEKRKRDDLNFSGLINGELREITAKGKQSDLLFIEGSDYPDAWEISGTYKIEASIMTVDCILFKNETEKSFSVKGSPDKLPALVNLVLVEVRKRLK